MKAITPVSIILSIALASCLSTSKQTDPDFDTKSKIAREFAVSLLSSNGEGAKLLSAPTQWNTIDEWIKAHQKISCKTADTNTARDSIISLELSGGSWFISGKFDEPSGQWLVDVSYECKTEPINYCFELNGSRIEKVNDEWKVIEWDTICEKNNDTNPCPNMCQ